MFVPFIHIHVLTHLHELLAIVLELVTLGEIRLRRRAPAGGHRANRGDSCSNRALARRLAGPQARPGRVVMLWPELDDASRPQAR